MKQETLEATAAAAAKVTYTGAGSAVFFGLTANEFAALGGLFLALCGLIVNIIFKYIAHRVLVKHHAQGKPISVDEQ
jgi:hypothetical protein